MSDIIDHVDKAAARLAQVNQELIDAEKEQKLHEKAARDLISKRLLLKEERQSLTLILGHAQIKKNVDDAAAAAVASKNAADEAVKRLADKEKELDELIAKHKGAVGGG